MQSLHNELSFSQMTHPDIFYRLYYAPTWELKKIRRSLRSPLRFIDRLCSFANTDNDVVTLEITKLILRKRGA